MCAVHLPCVLKVCAALASCAVSLCARVCVWRLVVCVAALLYLNFLSLLPSITSFILFDCCSLVIAYFEGSSIGTYVARNGGGRCSRGKRRPDARGRGSDNYWDQMQLILAGSGRAWRVMVSSHTAIQSAQVRAQRPTAARRKRPATCNHNCILCMYVVIAHLPGRAITMAKKSKMAQNYDQKGQHQR